MRNFLSCEKKSLMHCATAKSDSTSGLTGDLVSSAPLIAWISAGSEIWPWKAFNLEVWTVLVQ